MEEKKNLEMENANVPFEKEEQSAFDFAAIYTTIILNWKWFALSLIICLGVAAIYLRYTTPIYQAYAKLLIKDNEGNSSRNNMLNTSTLCPDDKRLAYRHATAHARWRYLARTLLQSRLYATSNYT